MKPLCFVLMPFGIKKDETGKLINFDDVYSTIISPAIAAADMEPIRADEEQVGGMIHKPMFERLLLCEYAVADVTGANPNVYYELGIRHALRARSTVILFAEDRPLPFDLAPLRGIPYRTDASGRPADPAGAMKSISARLVAARKDSSDDSPVFQLIDDMPRIEIDHTKTDLFRERADYSRDKKEELRVARGAGKAAVQQIAADPIFGNLIDVESGIVVDLFLSLRAVKAHEEMVDLFKRMPKPLQHVRLVREQFAFALNRVKRRDEAERVLLAVIEEFGTSSETNGLLGRVHKDRWDAAKAAGDSAEARGHLKKAIAAYVTGFETDWRDAYPGVNAVTLMELLDQPDPRQKELLPVVWYAAKRRAEAGGDYWDHATLLELAVVRRDKEAAEDALGAATATVREGWELESTADQLGLLRTARAARGEETAWIEDVQMQLLRKRDRLTADPKDKGIVS